MIEIPLYQNTSANFKQTIELGGQLTPIQIIYNIRNQHFMMTIIDQSGQVFSGIKMVPNWPLLRQSKASIDFSGDIIILKTTEEVEDVVTYDNFGSGWSLYYMTNEEYQEWLTTNGL